jgi:light-regulated signal transduction histidine kinase (bacteriophytochrome)
MKMDLIKIVEQHTETALREAEEIKRVAETMSGFAAMQNDRIKALLDDTSSILYQVAQSLDDAQDEDGPTKIIRPDPETWR